MLRPMVYDAGALIAAERGSVAVWRAHRAYLLAGGTPVVPAAVVAQVWRDGTRQARVAQLLKGCDIAPLGDESARAVGELLGRAGTVDTVDGAVALLASALGAEVPTSDPEDLQHLLDHLGVPGKRVTVRPL
ncbi:twitching motility protein PilT [Peterkaempfera bronchialis]|uniref:Twitching motility protein PilT n=1 Tax=Peterkaempfera bronchialis TaxID=2126346 RepID=A0A345SUZ1_9ACTN|nr:twitching motility protein PilT [Peterkaempfera bronchialis]AXI77546.1 twitching motility protein PilT [Peterkaempfera bronchialis]